MVRAANSLEMAANVRYSAGEMGLSIGLGNTLLRGFNVCNNSYLLVVIIVAVFQFFVGHKLNCPVHHTKKTRGEAFIEACEALVLGDLDKGVQHSRVVLTRVNIARKFLLKTKSKKYYC